MGNPTFFVDDSAVTARALEVPAASFGDGMNFAASNAPAIGVNMGEGAVVGSPEQFTLLDQDGDARTPQVSQQIGGDGYVDRSSVPYDSSGGLSGKGIDSLRSGTNSATGDGTVTPVDNAWLESLAAGWTEGDPTP